jgi:hypothetical protein
MGKLHPRHVKRGRQQVVGQRRVQELTLVVEGQSFVEGVAYALRDAALNLARQDARRRASDWLVGQGRQG